MENATEDHGPNNCIILSPEELVRLGIKINNTSSSPCPKNESNCKNDNTKGNKTKTEESDVLLQHARTLYKIKNSSTEDSSKPSSSLTKGQIDPPLIQNGTGSKVLTTDLSSNNGTTEMENIQKSVHSKKKEIPKKSINLVPNHVSTLNVSSSNLQDGQKRGRGRPKKSFPPMLNQSLICENAGNSNLVSNQHQKLHNDNISGNKLSDLHKDNKVLGTRALSDSDSDTPWETSVKKRKRGKSNYKPINSDSDSDSSSKDLQLHRKFVKVEASDSQDKSQFDDGKNSQVDNIGDTSFISEETKIHKKRGRPKKNSLESNKIVASTVSISRDNEIDDSLIKTSKRGRKRKEVNYLLLENPDLVESNSKIANNSLHDQSATCNRSSLKGSVEKKKEQLDLANDIKIEAHGVQYSLQKSTDDEESIVTDPVDTERNAGDCSDSELPTRIPQIPNAKDGAKDDNSTGGTSESTRYKWTGHVTKAINQMFSTIQQKNINDSEHDPLMGKTKRGGRRKVDADYLLDKEGTSVCMVCNETIPNPEWLEHKRIVHYNLTWRKGDPCIDLTNELVVQKTLTQLIRVYGEVKCYRCKQISKSAKKFISHLEMCYGIVNSTGCVTCAVCKTTLEKKNWSYHNYRQHNNCAWREGDPPLNLEDQDLVLRILNAIYKAKKPLHCEKCGQQKKSVLGYLSHKTTCQKTELELEDLKAKCHICGKKVLPVSMDYHLKIHDRENQEVAVVTDYFNVDVDITGKRKAAKQALEVINSIRSGALEDLEYYTSECSFQESFVTDILRKKLTEQSPLKCLFVDCEFSDTSVENIKQHLNSCIKKPEKVIVCKLCLSWYQNESDMHDHIKAEHKRLWKRNQDKEFESNGEENNSEEDELLEEVDREIKRLRLVGKQKLISQTNVKVKPIFLIHPIRNNPSTLVYQKAYSWMMEFCGANYNKFNLYQYLRNDQPWQVLDCDILNDYLPKSYQSCDIAAKVITVKENKNNVGQLDFRKMNLFEVSELYDGDVTIFCGGPVTALAWLPTPYDQKTHIQVLAVAVLNNMDTYYTINENYNEPCVMQFWDFGILDCDQKRDSKPSLLFGMALTCGPIWHLEWCPSGCLDCFEEDPTCRLGLLAVAASDSFVYIYSIDNLSDVNDRGLIFKGEPVLKLGLDLEVNTLDGQCYYPTKISWSKAAGHKYIAVGYSTGLIALYDLPNGSHVLKRGTNAGINIIFPYKSFQAHFSSITALTLSHLSDGKSLLLSGSFDRSLIFWDLTTLTKITVHKKNGIADGVWLTQWPTSLSVDDESTYNDKAHAHSYYKTIRYLMSPDGTNFTIADSGINGFSYSDWLNTILHGSNAGEVMAQFTHRMFFSIESKLFRSSYIKSLFSVTKLIRKDSSLDDVAITYDEATEKYNMAFLDYNLDNIINTPNSSTKNGLSCENLSRCDIREYSLQSIKKVVLNPNPQACSYYAIGYQSGFVRLQRIHFVNRFLPK